MQYKQEEKFQISAFYFFTELTDSELNNIKVKLEEFALDNNLFGLIIIANEGINGTCCILKENSNKFKIFLTSLNSAFLNINFKDSFSSFNTFKRFKIKVRDEIVTLERKDIIPKGANNHLEPKEWDEFLENENDYILIDTRNTYETKLGMFENAIDPGMDNFTEFKKYVEKLNQPKDKKVLMYCTGGIRCEKASYQMQEAGYKNVYQLNGGILKYLEEFPNKKFNGECFVFDHRVAVDQELKPSKIFKLCPHTGNPASLEIICKNCDKKAVVDKNAKFEYQLNSCSKNCAYHLKKSY